MKFFLVILFFLLTFLNLSAQNLEWVKSIGGANSEISNGVVVDKFGNSYYTGCFTGSVDFDSDTSSYIVNTIGLYDIFILKLNPAGKFLWVKTIGSVYEDNGLAIEIDSFQNVYITGYFEYTADFDPGPNVFNLINSCCRSGFILKLDVNGEFIWAHKLNSNNEVQCNSIKVGNNDLYVTGYFRGLNFDANPGSGVNLLNYTGQKDAFFIKFDLEGNFVWAGSVEGTTSGSEIGHSINTDNSGNVLICGSFMRTVDLNPGVGVFNAVNSTTTLSNDVFYIKLDSLGNFIFGGSIGGNYQDNPSKVICDSQNNIYIGGRFQDTVDFDPGVGVNNVIGIAPYNDEGFILKLDSLGNFIDVYTLNGNIAMVNDLAVDSSDNIFAIGNFSYNPLYLNFNSHTDTLISYGNKDIFVLKMNSTGDLVWANSFGGTQDDLGYKIISNLNRNLFFTGVFSDIADLDPSESNNYYLSSNGLFDIYYEKISECGSMSSTQSVIGCDSLIYNNFTYFESGTYHQQLNSVSGCDSIITLNLVITNVDSSVTQNNLTLTATSSGATYQWLDCNNNYLPITNETNQSFTATANGSYAVAVTENGCTDTSACFTISTIGISENGFGNDFKIFPNPSNGKLFIDLGKNTEKINVSVKNAIGQIVFENQISKGGVVELNLNVERGIYFVELISLEGNKVIYKLIID